MSYYCHDRLLKSKNVTLNDVFNGDYEKKHTHENVKCDVNVKKKKKKKKKKRIQVLGFFVSVYLMFPLPT